MNPQTISRRLGTVTGRGGRREAGGMTELATACPLPPDTSAGQNPLAQPQPSLTVEGPCIRGQGEHDSDLFVIGSFHEFLRSQSGNPDQKSPPICGWRVGSFSGVKGGATQRSCGRHAVSSMISGRRAWRGTPRMEPSGGLFWIFGGEWPASYSRRERCSPPASRCRRHTA